MHTPYKLFFWCHSVAHSFFSHELTEPRWAVASFVYDEVKWTLRARSWGVAPDGWRSTGADPAPRSPTIPAEDLSASITQPLRLTHVSSGVDSDILRRGRISLLSHFLVAVGSFSSLILSPGIRPGADKARISSGLGLPGKIRGSDRSDRTERTIEIFS